jgi:hypothetical protein
MTDIEFLEREAEACRCACLEDRDPRHRGQERMARKARAFAYAAECLRRGIREQKSILVQEGGKKCN